ncbi:hypothetical protein [Dyella sp.]|uniref:hypothetical protein n=1 Tax=Dyella sp. TaxID=1869338 RepID=UPI002ED20CF2
MSSTSVELNLSAGYRQAQRALAAWLEQGVRAARQSAFAARAALGLLDPSERGRLARWLAWLVVADSYRGDMGLAARVRRLDGGLHLAMEDALARLPMKTVNQAPQNHRLSA